MSAPNMNDLVLLLVVTGCSSPQRPAIESHAASTCTVPRLSGIAQDIDHGNAPVEGVTVSLLDAAGKQLMDSPNTYYVALTGKDGRFKFDTLPAGAVGALALYIDNKPQLSIPQGVCDATLTFELHGNEGP